MTKDEKGRRRGIKSDPGRGYDEGQSRRFIEAARELGADQTEEAFDDALRRIAKAPVRGKAPKKERN